jgi:branched-chain amino acid transport system permease protein
VQLLQLLISGVAQGCIYGLIALGFVLIYKATETVSFAQGDLMMVGAFSGLAAMTLLGFPFLDFCAGGHRGHGHFWRACLSAWSFAPSWATGFFHRHADHWCGLCAARPDHHDSRCGHRHPHPARALCGRSFALGRLVIAAEQMVVIGATGILCLGLFAMFKYSKLGIAMQAASQNQLAAYYMGIPVKQINGLVWGLAAAVAAVAGLLLAPITFVHANMGFIGLKAFPAAVVGGFGSLPGAIVGGW